MNYKKIDWSRKDEEDVFAYIDKLPKEEDYVFLKWIISNYTHFKVNWVEEFDHIRDHYSNPRSVELCKDFIDWFPEQFPEQYAENYNFVEAELCFYYFVHQQYEQLQKRLDYCAQYPYPGLGTVLTPIYYGLLATQKPEMAFDLACRVCHHLEDDSDEWEEVLFYKGVYLHLAEKAYEGFKETGKYDVKNIRHQLKLFEINIEENIINLEAELLQTQFDDDVFLKTYKFDYIGGQAALNIYFMQYMKDHYDFPFALSDEIWSLTMIKGLFGGSRFSDEFYYADADKLQHSIQSHSRLKMNLNTMEMIIKVFGLTYVFVFLNKMKLLTDESTDKMNQTINYFQYERLLIHFDELWLIDFVFDWKGTDFWKSYREKFKQIFKKNNEEVKAFYDQFEKDYEINERIRKELGEPVESRYQKEISEFGETYERSHQKVGRNDPCPCGSGKKFKKCCLGKGIYD